MTTNAFALPAWRRASANAGPAPRATAKLRVQPADFVVCEDLGYELTGDGEHDYLRIRKVDLNTDQVASVLARHAGVPRRDVGFSGMKDRRAVTTQWFSVRRNAKSTAGWATLEKEGVTLLECGRHRRKLKRGSHRHNTFRLRLRELDDPAGDLDERLLRVREQGVPNYFGDQRFGRAAGNIALAETLFGGAKLPRHRRSIALSAARSLIFNDVLSERVAAANWNRLVGGDLANLDGSNSVFAVAAPDATLHARVDAFDLHPTGPLWGDGSPSTTGEIGQLEAAVAARRPELKSGLEAMTREGRRALRVLPLDVEWAREADDLWIEFRLPRGAFATAVLREFVEITNA